MKTKLTFLLIMVASFAYADGGDNLNRIYSINEMEISFNLMYYSVDEEFTKITEKKKEIRYELTTNIAIYDINNDKLSYLLPDTLNEVIIGFYYELKFDAKENRILFNKDIENAYSDNDILEAKHGNYDLKERQLCDKVFIMTFSETTKRYKLWTAHKTGKDLKMLYEYDDGWEYEFDVRNKAIHFVKKGNNKVEVKSIKY